MNKFASLFGIAGVFAIGYFTAQQLNSRNPVESSQPEARQAAPAGDLVVNAGNRHQSYSPVSDVTSFKALPPHEREALERAAIPTPEDEAAREETQAEMIAALRAEQIPEADLAQLEQALTEQSSAGEPKNSEPAEERSSAEVSAELRESLRLSGAPAQIIEAVAQQIEAGLPTMEAPVLPQQRGDSGS